MPAPEIIFRHQQAVLWEKSGDDKYGEPLVEAPVEITVRWVTKRREVTGPDGTPVATDATVVVNQYIPINSILWLGTMAEWLATGATDPNTLLMQVMTYDETPDLKNRFVQRQVTLAFFRGTLPSLAP